MRLKLYYKFFGIVFLSIVLSLITAGVAIGYFGKKNFQQYLEGKMAKEFVMMADNLGIFYEQNHGFDPIVNGDVPLHFAFTNNGKPAPGVKSGTNGKAGAQKPGDEPFEPPHKKNIFTIFDKNMHYLAGGYNRPEDMHLLPVRANGKVVAHFGVMRRDKMADPFAEDFLARQSWLLLVTMVIVTILSSIMALLLSRNMLRPIRELKSAARKVAERDFDVDVRVNSNDELADLAEDFRRMVSTLKEYEQKQGRWISDISHELRTPLSVILGSIEAIQDGVRKPDPETLDSLYGNAVRVKRLVNELHDISIAESGVMHLHKVKADIIQELKSMLDFYEVRLAETGFRTQIKCMQDKVYVMADLMRMNQVYINILENTIKYAKSPGVLFVDCAPENGELVITFEDTGPGVSDEHLPFLFDRLYRVDSSRSRATGGSGLGLSICKYIVESHNGTITAQMGTRGGLKLIIRLPQEAGDE